jgi:hypothetical protein
MGRVVIGMDPHKRSATIEVCDERERVLQTGRFGTDRDGYRHAPDARHARRVDATTLLPRGGGPAVRPVGVHPEVRRRPLRRGLD